MRRVDDQSHRREESREREGQRVTHRRGIERDTPPRRETTLTRATEEDEPEKRPPTDQGNRERSPKGSSARRIGRGRTPRRPRSPA
ncbi:hypothetical protein F2Q69_00032595 [Brassica cretica]|uniref:Uncharacterized protein n=1 Tax=Brassica cretica TaxID=69181 RepID=A0A8S9S5L8_BRACR|nr:hypothetical protein F2Q69_00032595 [Brassica cretica]